MGNEQAIVAELLTHMVCHTALLKGCILFPIIARNRPSLPFYHSHVVFL
jgi:hypothetical protein